MKQASSLLFCLFVMLMSGRGQIIINHSNTDITSLSEDEINQAKSILHIAYGHTSHGSQVTDGMTGLVAFANGGGKGLNLPDDIFAWNIGGTDGALDLHDGAMGGDVGYYPQWYNNTVSYLGPVNPETGKGTANPDVNVIMWSWCGQVDDRYSEGKLYSDFLEPMHLLETTYPNVKFVYMTGHLDHWDDANNKAANDSIRRHCLREGKILYDFADIESYNPDGTFFEYAGDDCSYYNSNGDYLGNWAEEWRATHTEGVDWYNCGAAHSDALNANQKAYAAWAMFVEIAKAIKLEAIPFDLEVNDTIVSSLTPVCFNAQNNITVSDSYPVTIQNEASATFIAGQSIRFLPGFHAQAGSYVSAYITTTGSFCDDLPDPIMAAPPVAEKSYEFVEPDAETNHYVEQSMAVYPNPNNGQFTIAFTNFEGISNVYLFNAMGQKVYVASVNEQQHWVELPNMQRGIYFVKAINGQKQFDQKVVIQ